MSGVNVYEPSEVLFRRQLSAFLGGIVAGDADGFTAIRLTPITTVAKDAMTDIEGLLVFDGDLDKLCVGTAGGWETVTSS